MYGGTIKAVRSRQMKIFGAAFTDFTATTFFERESPRRMKISETNDRSLHKIGEERDHQTYKYFVLDHTCSSSTKLYCIDRPIKNFTFLACILAPTNQ